MVRFHNQIQEVRRKIRSEAQRMIRAAENDYQTAAQQESAVAAALEAAKAEAPELQRRGTRHDSLKRELEASKSVLNSLLSREKETDVAQQLKATNVKIVDEAVVPRAPIRPNPRRDIQVGIPVGTFSKRTSSTSIIGCFGRV